MRIKSVCVFFCFSSCIKFIAVISKTFCAVYSISCNIICLRFWIGLDCNTNAPAKCWALMWMKALCFVFMQGKLSSFWNGTSNDGGNRRRHGWRKCRLNVSIDRFHAYQEHIWIVFDLNVIYISHFAFHICLSVPFVLWIFADAKFIHYRFI